MKRITAPSYADAKALGLSDLLDVLCVNCGVKFGKHRYTTQKDVLDCPAQNTKWAWEDGKPPASPSTIPIHWTSPDGVYVVVECSDLPLGVLRTQNEALVERAIKMVYPTVGEFTSFRPHPGGGQGYYAAVKAADLKAPVKQSSTPVYDQMRQRWNTICNEHPGMRLEEGIIMLMIEELEKRDKMIKELRQLQSTPPIPQPNTNPPPMVIKSERQCYCGTVVRMTADVNKCPTCGKLHSLGLKKMIAIDPGYAEAK